VQLASAPTLAKGILARIADELRLQLTQRTLERALGTRLPHKVWSRFCQALSNLPGNDVGRAVLGPVEQGVGVVVADNRLRVGIESQRPADLIRGASQ